MSCLSPTFAPLSTKTLGPIDRRHQRPRNAATCATTSFTACATVGCCGGVSGTAASRSAWAATSAPAVGNSSAPVLSAFCMSFGFEAAAVANSASVGTILGAEIDTGPSLSPCPFSTLIALTRSGAAASRAVKRRERKQFAQRRNDRGMIERRQPGGRITEPFGTQGETMTAGTRTPK